MKKFWLQLAGHCSAVAPPCKLVLFLSGIKIKKRRVEQGVVDLFTIALKTVNRLRNSFKTDGNSIF